MKHFTVYYDEAYKAHIEAKDIDEARKKFYNGEYDEPEYREISGVDIIEEAV